MTLRLVDQAAHVRFAAHVGDHGPHCRAMTAGDSLEVRLGCQRVVERGVVGTAVGRHHVPPRINQRGHRRCTDTPAAR